MRAFAFLPQGVGRGSRLPAAGLTMRKTAAAYGTDGGL